MTEPLVSVAPDSLTLAPGASAQVTVSVDSASPYGFGSVPISVTVPPPYDGTIEGSFGGLIPNGEHWHITGDFGFTGDIIVEGLLTSIDSFTAEGNGFQLLVQNGGQLDIKGIPKSAWKRWGQDPVGWQVGDRLGIAPTATLFRSSDGKLLGEFDPVEGLWTGDWDTVIRPSVSPSWTLFNGRVMEPEVCNLSQTIVFKNLRRIHFHDGAGLQILKWLKVLDSGVEGVLDQYPIHFHFCGDSTRESLLEGVVVENGKNHAFVPHGSHGITLRDCAAYKTRNHAFWWNDPLDHQATDLNNSHDSFWTHVLALGVDFTKALSSATYISLAGFQLGAGRGSRLHDSAVAGVKGGSNSAGLHWPSKAGNADNVWLLTGEHVIHNCANNGSRVWQNDANLHVVSNLVVYNIGDIAVNHGAYLNRYVYENLLIDCLPGRFAFALHAISRETELTISDVTTNGPLRVAAHSQESPDWIPVRVIEASFTGVVYTETIGTSLFPAYIIYENDVLELADYDMTGAHLNSIAEIVEGGVVTDRWQSGVWS